MERELSRVREGGAGGKGGGPRVHFFSSFFINKLYKDGGEYQYNNVRRWTTEKKLGYSILDCDMVIVPVHQGIHWVRLGMVLYHPPHGRAIWSYDN